MHERKPPDSIVLDMDSSESPTHGQQEGSVWNGHFGCTCYHPLFVFNQYGDLERCLLRPGNVHSAEDWHLALGPVIARYRKRGIEIYFRSDAAFAKPELYELLEAEDIQYVIRLPANPVLQRRIGHLLTRPVGRPPKKPIVTYASFRYQATGWTRARRVVAKVEWHRGELYPRVGFIVTNLSRPAERHRRGGRLRGRGPNHRARQQRPGPARNTTPVSRERVRGWQPDWGGVRANGARTTRRRLPSRSRRRGCQPWRIGRDAVGDIFGAANLAIRVRKDRPQLDACRGPHGCPGGGAEALGEESLQK